MMLIGEEPQSYPSYRDIALSATPDIEAFLHRRCLNIELALSLGEAQC